MNAIKMKQTIQHEPKYNVISWGIPLLISLIPFVVDVYGQAGFWCWIIKKDEWRFGLWFGPVMFVSLVLFFVYFYIIWSAYKLDKAIKLGLLDPMKERSMLVLKSDVRPLIAYPLVYLIVNAFAFVNRIQNNIEGEPSDGLVISHVIFSSLQSGINAIVFSCNADITWRLRPSQIKLAFKDRFGANVQLKNTDDGKYPVDTNVTAPQYNLPPPVV